MESSTLDPRQPQPQEGAKPPKCRVCLGMGEVVARSRNVGGGCVNDDWDLCPACNGTGEVRAAWSTDAAGLSELELEALR